MVSSVPPRPAAAAGLVLAAGGALAGVLLLREGVSRAGAAVRAAGPAGRPDQLLAVPAALAAGLLLCWLGTGVALALAGALTRRDRVARAGARLLPRLLHGLLAAALGGALVLGAGPDALAAGSPSPSPAAPAGTSTAPARPASAALGPAYGSPAPAPDLPDPGWTPQQPPAPPVLPAADVGLVSAHGRAGPVEDRVVVRRGDTLWAIAARHLGAGASAGQIAREWPRWYAANRAVIGPDPDLLRPGQHLRPPPVR